MGGFLVNFIFPVLFATGNYLVYDYDHHHQSRHFFKVKYGLLADFAKILSAKNNDHIFHSNFMLRGRHQADDKYQQSKLVLPGQKFLWWLKSNGKRSESCVIL